VGVAVGWQPGVPGWQVGVGVGVQGKPSESTHGVAVLVGVPVGVSVNVGVSVGLQPIVPGWQVGVGVGVQGKPIESTHGVGVSVGTHGAGTH
jgi:hypothetical protein